MKLKKFCGNCEVEWLNDEWSTEQERCDSCSNYTKWKPSLWHLEHDLKCFIDLESATTREKSRTPKQEEAVSVPNSCEECTYQHSCNQIQCTYD